MLYRYLLFVRFILLNLVALSLLGAAYLQGWFDAILAAPLKELSGLIVLVFLYGLGLCGLRIWSLSLELNALKAEAAPPYSRAGSYLDGVKGADSDSRSIQASALRLRVTDRIAVVRQIANALIFLGLIGTVIGFIIALSGIDPAAAGNAENVSAMVSTLINGMSIALNTTLVGAILYVWLIIDYRILVGGTVDFLSLTMEMGEARARGA